MSLKRLLPVLTATLFLASCSPSAQISPKIRTFFRFKPCASQQGGLY